MTGPRFQRDATPDDIVASLDEHGYAIVERLADEATLARLNADFDPYIDAVQLGKTDFAGHKTKRINNLIAKSTACQDLALNPTIMAVCDRVLLPHCARYQLHVGSLIELEPGEAEQVAPPRRRLYPVRFPAIADDAGDDVGLHRLHRRERRHPDRARQPPVGARARALSPTRSSTPRCRRARC